MDEKTLRSYAAGLELLCEHDAAEIIAELTAERDAAVGALTTLNKKAYLFEVPHYEEAMKILQAALNPSEAHNG